MNPDQTPGGRAGHRARHAAPRHTALRRIAAGAAVVATGAMPLATAASAQAAVAPGSVLPGANTDLVSTVRDALPAGALEHPLSVNGTSLRTPTALDPVAALASSTLGAGALPPQTRQAVTAPDRAASSAELTAARLIAAGQAEQLAPQLLERGALGGVTSDLAPRAQSLTGRIATGAAPTVSRLHAQGVPTVGDVTRGLGRSSLPSLGNVGRLTQSLPVESMLGPDDPLSAALNNATRL